MSAPRIAASWTDIPAAACLAPDEDAFARLEAGVVRQRLPRRRERGQGQRRGLRVGYRGRSASRPPGPSRSRVVACCLNGMRLDTCLREAVVDLYLSPDSVDTEQDD